MSVSVTVSVKVYHCVVETDHLTGRMGSMYSMYPFLCTHSAHQMVRLHSHNVNLMDMETETVSVNRPLGSVRLRPIYIKRQGQHCDNSAMTLAILFSLKTLESLQNGVAAHFQVTSLFSMRILSMTSLQSSHSIDPDTCCKRTLIPRLM